MLLVWARSAKAYLGKAHRVVESTTHWPMIWAWACPALVILLGVLIAQRSVRPFAFRSQNQMEAWLLSSSVVLVLLACAYSAASEQVDGEGGVLSELRLAAEQINNATITARLEEASQSLRVSFDFAVLTVLFLSLVLPFAFIVRDCVTYKGEERGYGQVGQPQGRAEDAEISSLRLQVLEHERQLLAERAEAQEVLEVEMRELRLKLQQQMARTVPSEQVLAATDSFSDELKIGQGSFGSVYRASTMSAFDSLVGCAVKRLVPGTNGDRVDQSLLSELHVLGLCRHEHLLPLLGYCLEPGLHCLIFPLMAGGSLEDRLLPSDDGSWQRLATLGFDEPPPPLGWKERLRVLRDAARALVYLHTPSEGKSVLLRAPTCAGPRTQRARA